MTSTIGEVLPTAARRFGARTALLVGERSFSFDDLEALSNRVANGLVSAACSRATGSRCTARTAGSGSSRYYAIAKTGAVVNPINVMLTPEEVRYVVEDSGARAVVASVDKGGPLLDCADRRPRDRRPVGRRSRRATALDVEGEARSSLRCTASRRRSGGHLLHVGDHGPSEGSDAEPPLRDRRRGGHGDDGGALARTTGSSTRCRCLMSTARACSTRDAWRVRR